MPGPEQPHAVIGTWDSEGPPKAGQLQLPRAAVPMTTLSVQGWGGERSPHTYLPLVPSPWWSILGAAQCASSMFFLCFNHSEGNFVAKETTLANRLSLRFGPADLQVPWDSGLTARSHRVWSFLESDLFPVTQVLSGHVPCPTETLREKGALTNSSQGTESKKRFVPLSKPLDTG